MPGPSDNPAVCAAESSAGTVQSDPTCAYRMWVVWSADGGSTWDGGGGALPGTAATAYEVDPSTKPQTDVYPAIAAGDPGEVDVAWLGTNEIEPTERSASSIQAAALDRVRPTAIRPSIRRPVAGTCTPANR